MSIFVKLFQRRLTNSYTNKGVSIFCHILLAALVLPLVIFYKKEESLLFINLHYSAFLDVFMYHITRLPEIAYILFLLALGLFTQKRFFLAVAVAMIICGLTIVLNKYFIFADAQRPFSWLTEHKVSFHHVEGIQHHKNGSFPSGHTMAAFCALALAGFISNNKWLQFFFFVLAAVSGYSRVYVAQHYLIDVYVGSLLGFLIAYIIFSLFERIFKTPYWQQPMIKL